MGQNNSTDLRKSYHTLPMLVDQFQNNSMNQSVYASNNNQNYCIEDRKFKLTLNDYEVKDIRILFDTKDMLSKSEIDEESEKSSDENNALDAQDEDSFRMQVIIVLNKPF